MKTFMYEYRIDSEDRVSCVDSDWLAYARDNGAGELSKSKVVGTSLWQYIQGSEIISLYKSLFERIRRENGSTIIPYRCDSPGTRRLFDLYIRKTDDGNLQLKSKIVKVEKSRYNPVFDMTLPSSKEQYDICSVCKDVNRGKGEWVSLERALIGIDVKRTLRPSVRNVICPKCSQLIGLPPVS